MGPFMLDFPDLPVRAVLDDVTDALARRGGPGSAAHDAVAEVRNPQATARTGTRVRRGRRGVGAAAGQVSRLPSRSSTLLEIWLAR
ncbi:hypothetical protein AB0I53_22030 [Saccharopolyspora sp. NPDC050389]|uniref:hypothetical protein n=1 Tax=Saccharopolyspora sp. NPDC050389 TaxID=3155516 RepID=UPI0033F228A5